MTRQMRSLLRSQSLGGEIARLLAVKAAALLVLFLLFFSPAQRPQISASSLEAQFFKNSLMTPKVKP